MWIIDEFFQHRIFHEMRHICFSYNLVEVVIVFSDLFFLVFEGEFLLLFEFMIRGIEQCILTILKISTCQYSLMKIKKGLCGLYFNLP